MQSVPVTDAVGRIKNIEGNVRVLVYHSGDILLYGLRHGPAVLLVEGKLRLRRDIFPVIGLQDNGKPGFPLPGGILVHGGGRLARKGHGKAGEKRVIKHVLIKQVGNIVPGVVVVKIGGIVLVLNPVVIAQKAVVIHGPHHGCDIRIPFKRPFQVFGELLIACPGKGLLHGAGPSRLA